MTDEEITKHLEAIKDEKDIFNKARTLRDLIKNNQLRIVDVAKKLSMKPSYLCHILRLNKLPDMIVDGYYSQLITLSHLFVISRLKTKEDMISIYEKILRENKTVIQIEEEVRSILYGVRSDGTYLKKEEIQTITERIRKKYREVQIKIIQTRIKSKCIIEIKGSLSRTTELLKSLMKHIEAWEKDKSN